MHTTPSSPVGLHRVIDPAGAALPQAAAVIMRVSAMTALEARRTRLGFRVCTTALLPSCEAPDLVSGREMDDGGL